MPDRPSLPRIHYVANVRLPSERANAYQIFAQCDALVARGVDVVLIAPKRRNRFRLSDDRIPAYYGLRQAPRLERLFTIDWIESVPRCMQRAPFVLQSITFAAAVGRRLRRNRARLVYSRDPWTLAWLSKRPGGTPSLYYEVHDLPERREALDRLSSALRRCRGVIAITAGLAADVRGLGVAEDRIRVLADGFDPRRFETAPDRARARAELGLDADRPLAVYTGHLYPWKGAHVLVEAAARSTRFDVLLVGGWPDDRARLARRVEELGASNVRLVEPVEPARVPEFLAAADVVVLPNSGGTRISARYTSPLKLFEYMAAGRPIVASDLPSIREVLDESNAVLVPADDAEALQAGIERCLADRAAADRRCRRARDDVAGYTWDARADRLIAALAEWEGRA